MESPLISHGDSNVRLCVVDGHGLLYRSFYAIRNLSTAAGRPTNATYGFMKGLLKMVRQLNPDFLSVAFDSKGPTFRKVAYENYKSGRPAMPEDLQIQVGDVKEVLSAAGVDMVSLEGFEADDIMAHMAKWGDAQGWTVILISTDKDVLQLVSDRIIVYNPVHELLCDPATVERRMGVRPCNVVGLLALAGDPTDSIPGVPGVGLKTAAKLLNQCGSLEEVMNRARSHPEDKMYSKVAACLEDVARWKDLAILRTDVPISVSSEAMQLRRGRPEGLQGCLNRLEMTSLLKDMMSVFSASSASDVGESDVREES